MLDLPVRMRRLRATPGLRALVREHHLRGSEFVLPIFVSAKVREPAPVGSMPGVFQWPLEEVERAAEGVGAVILFGIPAEKDETAAGAWADDGIVQQAVRRLKKARPELVVMTDVCLCEYMSHGHCGVARFYGDQAFVDNDASVALLARTALSHAAAGADIVAPSDMMDGRVGAIRGELDRAGFAQTVIMSYAAKFASAFYGPFRDAAESAPQAGDRHSYQMDPANRSEALREVELDLAEGADIILVKPGLAYLDLLAAVKQRFEVPTAVYCVSGEYAMVKAAAANGWLEERAVVVEMMTAFKRAGADLIVTYWARDLVDWLKK